MVRLLIGLVARLSASVHMGCYDYNQPVFDFHDSVHKGLRKLTAALHVRPHLDKDTARRTDILKGPFRVNTDCRARKAVK